MVNLWAVGAWALAGNATLMHLRLLLSKLLRWAVCIRHASPTLVAVAVAVAAVVCLARLGAVVEEEVESIYMYI